MTIVAFQTTSPLRGWKHIIKIRVIVLIYKVSDHFPAKGMETI